MVCSLQGLCLPRRAPQSLFLLPGAVVLRRIACLPAAAAALATSCALWKSRRLQAGGGPDTGGPTVPPRLAALHTLLLDLGRIPDARCASPPILPALLEEFWQELATSQLPDAYKEALLHRLADTYGHGTLRIEQARRVASILGDRGVDSLLDPLAHTGFHGSIFAGVGLIVELADSDPSLTVAWGRVSKRQAEDTRWSHFRGNWALFLCWLPHWNEVGVTCLSSFQGDIVVVLGDDGGWTATAGFREELHQRWDLVDSWSAASPWPRVKERLSIFVRRVDV